ncbi:MAG: hypothetical protein A3K03_12165 [Bdellovibrionales bacterium RIFOXYD1_FULL_44_7]|nr:MAG: hypothetical protein A3K03_12165 [Bdellovibrionales bacterium RIFOXYD1_FULL_44_7]
MGRPSNVAKEILAYCTSCKMDLNHVVVAMQGDRIVKVECKTCNKTHTYRAPKGLTEPKAKATKKGKKQADKDRAIDTSIEGEWQRLMVLHREAPTRTYTMKTKFILGDKLKHPNFGEGIVGRLIYPNKIEVIFKTDMKLLIHGGS